METENKSDKRPMYRCTAKGGRQTFVTCETEVVNTAHDRQAQ